ncbi:MAG: ABC transporter ATP-binding protein [Chloroflexia bacterium]|nr:ABC transporter ATP-binding protein [Chloroflexia bacterium]
MSGVSVQGLQKRFGSVQALDDVSLDVPEGELIALLGPSGCGKTTLLRAIAGLEKPDAGRITIGGQDVTAAPTRQRPIGMVFQSYVLFPNLSLRDNIGFPLKVRGVGKEQTRRRVDELLELVGLASQADRYPHQVSGGQQQRGALARALAPEPKVLLLDEPLSALDALVRHRLRDEIRRIQQMVRITALYVTHDQAEAMAIADQVAVMNAGRIEQLAAPPALYDDPATRFAASFVGNRNALDLPVRDGVVGLGDLFAVPAPVGANGRAVAFFRPEDVRLLADGAGQAATVESRMFQGLLTRLSMVVEGDGVRTRLYADLPSREANGLGPGSVVRVAIDPADVRVFPA